MSLQKFAVGHVLLHKKKKIWTTVRTCILLSRLLAWTMGNRSLETGAWATFRQQFFTRIVIYSVGEKTRRKSTIGRGGGNPALPHARVDGGAAKPAPTHFPKLMLNMSFLLRGLGYTIARCTSGCCFVCSSVISKTIHVLLISELRRNCAGTTRIIYLLSSWTPRDPTDTRCKNIVHECLLYFR